MKFGSKNTNNQPGDQSRFPVLIIIIGLFFIAAITACTSARAVRSGSADLVQAPTASAPAKPAEAWTHLSSADGASVVDGPTQQTAALLLDIDGDGRNDFVIGGRNKAPALVWYRNTGEDWQRFLIDEDRLPIEAGGAFYDIDGDGDQDIVMGEDYQGNHVYWWENPAPDYDAAAGWPRHTIKDSGANKHHDQLFGDVDGDGQAELVFWNQRAKTLFLADIPARPKTTQPWPLRAIYSWKGGEEHEGLALADIDGDGLQDIIGGGRWFKYQRDGSFAPNVIDDAPRRASTRAAAGQLKAGGAPEVVLVPGDSSGPLRWYEWNGSRWDGHDLLDAEVDHGHSLALADINGDEHLDIFCAEMRLDGGNNDAKMWALLGDGQGHFTTTVVAEGYGNHESRLGDLDGDGDADILGKPYNWQTPRVDIWLNNTAGSLPGAGGSLDRWQRHVIDSARSWQAVFITAADINSDALPDIITGGRWYANPGLPGGTWTSHTIGAPLHNMAAVFDADGDGDMDILGTQGKGSSANDAFVWARNEGGSFSILQNIAAGDGDFLQGVAVASFQGERQQVALSWHTGGKGVQMLRVPSDPVEQMWPWQRIASRSQDEALSAGDIDGDGDRDLLLGTQWLRNDGDDWSIQTLHTDEAPPDRNRLADINGDGKLDAVVGYEAVSKPGKLAWYARAEQPGAAWQEHVIAEIIGPMSLDVSDMDGDGDSDVVVGEHNLQDPASATLYVFENADGKGTAWLEHRVYTGDEHHDGAQVVDIDNDGDNDIISIGWGHSNVLLYENRAIVRE